MQKGLISLIGAGPGDPGLITVKGLSRLSRADAVVYDRLASPALLGYVRAGAERYDVGKESNRHPVPQHEINKLLIRLGQEGKRVARLKGGDPFIFGRGGEEGERLQEAGIPFEVIPGISSCYAAPAYAGIPVTHRDAASSFHVITGHERAGEHAERLDYEVLARLSGTLVFLMGLRSLPQITDRLIAAGKSAATPAAVIERGATPAQRVVTGTLGDIAALAEKSRVVSPAITVIGEVVPLRESLQWYDNRPLIGKRGLVTRARTQAGALSALLEEAGCQTLEFPVLAFEETGNPELAALLDDLSAGALAPGWLVLTSPNGAERFLSLLAQRKIDHRRLLGQKIAAIGPGTAKVLAEAGLYPDLVPETYTADALGLALAGRCQGEAAVLLRAQTASPDLPKRLTDAGIPFRDLPLYRTILPQDAAASCDPGAADFVTFTSSSTVQNLCALVKEDVLGRLRTLPAFCIGEITADAARKSGFSNIVTARSSTIPALAETVVTYYTGAAQSAGRL